MTHKDPVNWQPISEMPLIASMIDGALEDTREHMRTLYRVPLIGTYDPGGLQPKQLFQPDRWVLINETWY